ncbi:MAG: cell division protein ZapA [Muribaculaceae bacterium]|nr:cell division protein ZapA [Muribaculaceae bacterium]
MISLMEEKKNISIQIADLKPIPLKIDPALAKEYQEAEAMVNSLWNKWSVMFNGKVTPQELLARIAFQFARLYSRAYKQSEDSEQILSDLEKRLEKLVVQVD